MIGCLMCNDNFNLVLIVELNHILHYTLCVCPKNMAVSKNR